MTLPPDFRARRPRLDPLGLLPVLLTMSGRDIGLFAAPYLKDCLDGRATIRTRHILDMCGWALTCREQGL